VQAAMAAALSVFATAARTQAGPGAGGILRVTMLQVLLVLRSLFPLLQPSAD